MNHVVSIEAAAEYAADPRGTMRPGRRLTVAVKAVCSCGWESEVGSEDIVREQAIEHTARASA